MKPWLSLVLAAALVVACVTVPLGRRTVWGHAKDHGVPQATGRVIAAGARGIASGASAAWTWVTARPEAAKAVPRSARKEAKAARPVAPAAHFRAGPAGQATPQAKATLHPEAPAAPDEHGILAEPPAEQLTDTDKAGLERLVAGAAKRK